MERFSSGLHVWLHRARDDAIHSLIVPLRQLTKNKKTEDYFMVLFDEAVVAKEYENMDEVVAGLSEYCLEYDTISANDEKNRTIDAIDWLKENEFFILIHMKTKNIKGIRTTYGARFYPWEELFASEYVPVKYGVSPVPSYASSDEIATAAIAVLERFQSEVSAAFQGPLPPIFLLDRAYNSDYIAWSLSEQKRVMVLDYKSYLSAFMVDDISGEYEPVSSEGRYTVIAPSDELARFMGLRVNSGVYSRRCVWDKWSPREHIVGCREIIPAHFRSRYDVCIETLNRSFERDLGYGPEFSRLEERVKLLERLCRATVAPDYVIDKEIALIEGVLPLLENIR